MGIPRSGSNAASRINRHGRREVPFDGAADHLASQGLGTAHHCPTVVIAFTFIANLSFLLYIFPALLQPMVVAHLDGANQ